MSKYIDADRFERVIMSCGSSVLDDDAAYTVIGLLNDEAPANVEPVKRAHWVLERDLDGRPYCYHCSNCDSDGHYIGITTGYNYCPNCGAKMEADK